MKFWYQQTNESVLSEQSVVQAEGLGTADVQQRLQKFGANQLQAKKRINPFKLFISQFQDALIIVLIVSAFVSLGLSFVPAEKTLHDEAAVKKATELCAQEVPSPLAGISANCAIANGTAEAKLIVKEKESPKESVLIFAIVIAIALIGFLNEYKAEKTVEALKKLVGQKAKVRRGGHIIEVDAASLVPGDIVLLDEGQKVPADLRLLTVKNMQINEASLTGESVPVSKNSEVLKGELPLGDQKNMAFAGTFVAQGTAEGVVVATGQNTELGKIASLVNSIEADETPMQKKLDDLGRRLGLMITIVCVAVFAIVLLFVEEAREKDMLQRIIFAFTAAVALAVAAIPEGLAFVVRISLALGARRMAGKNALVRKLSAVEALGSTDVICSDKTGTLTKGEMTVRELWIGGSTYSLSGSGYDMKGELSQAGKNAKATPQLELLLRIGSLCNNAHIKGNQVLGDPTEGALLVSAGKLGFDYHELQAAEERVDEVPFTSERKRMSTVHKGKGKYVVATKGALELVLQLCDTYINEKGKAATLTKEVRAEIMAQNKTYAQSALRVLGFAYKESKTAPKGEKAIESKLTFIGMQAMIDPPRPEVVEVVHRVHTESGMRVIMITGDYPDTAKAIAHEIGIEGEVLTGPEIEKMHPEDFAEAVENVSIYARVNPEHKIRIVQALKKHGHQVAMTGDGVNDAPAIKAADIGIAMGITGTDAAKEAADLILLDDKFLTIINAIEEGRGIFDNVRKFVNFLISCNIAEVIAIVLGIVFFNNLILTAAQLLFINIVTDGLPAVALGSDPARADALRAKPSYFQQAIITKRVWVEMVAFGLLKSSVLLTQYWYNHTHESPKAAVSAAFISMIVFEMVRLVDIRTSYKIKWFSNPWLSVAIVSSLALSLMVLYTPFIAEYFEVGPLSGHDWLIMLFGATFLFVFMKILVPFFNLFGHHAHHLPSKV